MKFDKRRTTTNNLKELKNHLHKEALRLENEFCDGQFSENSKVGELYLIIGNASYMLDKIFCQLNDIKGIK